MRRLKVAVVVLVLVLVAVAVYVPLVAGWAGPGAVDEVVCTVSEPCRVRMEPGSVMYVKGGGMKGLCVLASEPLDDDGHVLFVECN